MGVAVGSAVAAKLIAWPLVVWLLVTRRFAAAAWATGSAVVLVLGAWALVGFDGLRDYPKLLRVLQDVYAVRSISVSTVASVLGASEWAAISAAVLAGVACVVAAVWVVRRDDGDRRAFAILVAACILASPIVWPNYIALLFVPIAVTWPRIAPIWFFGYGIWLLDAVVPLPSASDVCCKPADVPQQAWDWSHTEPALWYPLGAMAIVACIGIVIAAVVRERPAAPIVPRETRA